MIAKSFIEEFEKDLELLPDKVTFEEIKEIAYLQWIALSLNLVEFHANQIVDRTLIIAALWKWEKHKKAGWIVVSFFSPKTEVTDQKLIEFGFWCNVQSLNAANKW